MEVVNAIGRRKSAIARVYVSEGTGKITINKKDITRALVKINAEDKKSLKDKGFLTRDARAVERKKPGRPKARRRFQFSKR